MQRQLDRILNLVKKTGDRLVVLDRDNPQKSYVVMNINDYEMLVDGNECRWDNDDESDDFYSEHWDRSDDDEEEDDDDWDFKPESYLKDDLKEDNNELDFNEPPIIDLDDSMPEDRENEDFTPIDEIFAARQGKNSKNNELDNNSEYGTIKHNYQDNINKKSNRWEIPSAVKENEENEDDRYYLETI
jgi:hypothetical protein